MRGAKTLIFIGVLAAAGGLAYAYQPLWLPQLMAALPTRKEAARPERDRSIPVVAAPVALADVPVYASGVGTVKPLNSVLVRAQVSGKVTEIDFSEGQDLKKGDPIARLDDSLYRAQLDQARGKQQQDEAILSHAILELERVERLAGNSAGTQQQVDNQRALVAQYRAQVQSDIAAVAAAEAQLRYTTITAPIDGRTGIRVVDVGNLVSSGDQNGIVTLSQIRPIAVLFSVPQQDLARINAANASGPLKVEALGADGETVIGSGRLLVVDNQVDAATGTIKLKAEFPNEQLSLWPGAFVNARLLVETRKDMVTAPASAVQRGPGGSYVYLVGDNGRVHMQAVTVSSQDDKVAVFADGVAAGDTVVTAGFSRLQDGSEVRVSTPEEADPSRLSVPLADQTKQRNRRGGGKNGGGKRSGNRSGEAAKPDAGAAPAGDAAPKAAPAAGSDTSSALPGKPADILPRTAEATR